MDTIDVTLIAALTLTLKTFAMWIVVGIVAGLLARAILPGEQKMNILATMALGIGGALLGGFVASKLAFTQGSWWMVLIVATIGAFVLLIIFEAIKKMLSK